MTQKPWGEQARRPPAEREQWEGGGRGCAQPGGGELNNGAGSLEQEAREAEKLSGCQLPRVLGES